MPPKFVRRGGGARMVPLSSRRRFRFRHVDAKGRKKKWRIKMKIINRRLEAPPHERKGVRFAFDMETRCPTNGAPSVVATENGKTEPEN